MTGNDLRQKYLDFFVSRDHLLIPSAPLVPENDPTTLFTSSGMQPLVPYLLGQPHPSGKTRLVDSQKSFRAQDIEEVGDNRHTTFFEMLGNWSLGDYFKKEQLPWIFEFLTKEVGLDPHKLYITVFSGDPNNNIPRDDESIKIWKDIFHQHGIDADLVELVTEKKGYEEGMQGGRIFSYNAKKNWWSRSGMPDQMPAGEPGGPDSEIFYDFGTPHDPEFGKHCHPNCDCGRFLEIGNSVFMQYQKQEDGSLKELPNKNVDFGGGLERILAAANNDLDVFKTDLFWPVIEEIEKFSDKKYTDNQATLRVIADHLKAASFMIAENIEPSNKQQGYILRRLLRRAAVKMHQLHGGLTPIPAFEAICHRVIDIYPEYFDSNSDRNKVSIVIGEEMGRFAKTLDKGLRQINTLSPFDLYQTYGFPIEVTEELYSQKGKPLDRDKFNQELQKHQELSRTASKGMFKGGLADHSETVTKYHTATHLLHQALRQVLGDHVHQTGSNITADRLRFDFTHPQALTESEIKEAEVLINEQIKKDLPVTNETMTLKEAKAQDALAFFGEKYGDKVKVYSIGSFSKEVCGGPHVAHTGVIGPIKIYKQESVGSGRRRLYAKLA